MKFKELRVTLDEAVGTKKGWILKRGLPSKISDVKSATIIYHGGKAIGEAHKDPKYPGYVSHHYKADFGADMHDSMDEAIDNVKEMHRERHKNVTESREDERMHSHLINYLSDSDDKVFAAAAKHVGVKLSNSPSRDMDSISRKIRNMHPDNLRDMHKKFIKEGIPEAVDFEDDDPRSPVEDDYQQAKAHVAKHFSPEHKLGAFGRNPKTGNLEGQAIHPNDDKSKEFVIKKDGSFKHSDLEEGSKTNISKKVVENPEEVQGLDDQDDLPESKQTASWHQTEITRLKSLSKAARDVGDRKSAKVLDKRVNFHTLALKNKLHMDEPMAESAVGEIKPSEKGTLHTALGVAKDKKIPAGKLEKAEHSTDPALKKKAVFAANAKKWHHESFADFTNKPIDEFFGKTSLSHVSADSHEDAAVHHQLLAITADNMGDNMAKERHQNLAHQHVMWADHDKAPTTPRPKFGRPSLILKNMNEEADSDKLDNLEEGANYHSLFVHHEGEWQHHADFDDLEDARDEKDYLKRKGERAYHAVVPKKEANWDKPGAAHKYMTKKLGLGKAK